MRLFPVLTLMLFLSGFPAAGAEPRYAIGRVAVTGGHPVREMALGVVFVQDFNEDCSLVPSGPAGPAFAGSISSEVGISIDVVSCPRSAPDPEVRCHWELAPAPPADPTCREAPGPPTAGHWRWAGKSVEQKLRLPAATGAYKWTLACDVAGSRTEIESDLYVTYSEPLAVVSYPTDASGKVPVDTTGDAPGPKRSWYRLASCWGAGFAADDGAHALLETMRERAYEYGRRHWKYGFGNRYRTGSYFYPLRQVPAAWYYVENPELEPSCWYGFYCLCGWQALAEPDSGCAFGNCKSFAQTLYYMSATLGVTHYAELYNFTIKTNDGKGFLVSPGARSLDPAFLANVNAEDPTTKKSYSYYFTNHWLVRYCPHGEGAPCRYFDPTFNRTYDDPMEVAALVGKPSSALCPVREICTAFENSNVVLLPGAPGYGTWSYFESRYPGLRPPPLPRPIKPEPLANVTFRPIDESDGKLAEVLAVVATIPVSGNAFALAVLMSGDRPIASKPAWDVTQPTTGILVPGSTTGETIFLFSGEMIYQAGADGVYKFVAAVVDGDDVDHLYVAESEQSFDHNDFGELAAEPATLTAARASCTDDSGATTDCVRAELTLDVREHGAYVITLTLEAGGKNVATAARTADLDPGTWTIDLEVGHGLAFGAVSYSVTVDVLQSRHRLIGTVTATVAE